MGYHSDDALVGCFLCQSDLGGEGLDEVERMLIAAVGEREVADAKDTRFGSQTHGSLAAEGQTLHGLGDDGLHHAACGRIHGGDVAIEVALHNAHGRSFDEQAEEGVLLFEAEVFGTQPGKQVVEGVDDDVCLVLS